MKKKFNNFCIAFIAILFIASCQKDIEGPNTIIDPVITPTPSDITTKVTASLISGFVTDGNDVAVKDASVQIGTSNVLTDKYGYFEVRNVQVVQNAAMVTVNKNGFFKGIKTYIATANKAAFFRIKLIPKTVAGTINATAGGTVIVTGGLLISFPANAIVNASTNAAYTGTVNVTAYKIDPTNANLPRIMPGDLRGLNTESQLQLLTSYGMAAVELTGAGGELLQIATGKKATMTMPIASTILATSPASIPLWYFDETIGLWKQEGIATKIGNNYVGDVSHFSFWNYDVPSNYVQFNCTVVNTAGQPLQNAYVKISLQSNPFNAGYGFTDSSGYVSGAVPNNAQLKLEIFANAACGGAAAFSQNFSTTNVNVVFGNATINTTASVATLTGSVKNCAGLPVTNGYIVIREGNLYNRIALSNTGTYSHNKLFCSFPTQITLIGEDVTNLQQNLPVTYNVTTAGVNNIQAITACGVNTQQFINYTINGAAYNFSAPTDSLRFYNSSGTSTTAYINGFTLNNNSSFYVFFNSTGLAPNSTQNLEYFSASQINDSTTINTPILVNITEYGAIGEFIAGNFAGPLNGGAPNNIVYNVTCNFRMKRYN
jgi:hypothetical protein